MGWDLKGLYLGVNMNPETDHPQIGDKGYEKSSHSLGWFTMLWNC